MENKQTQELIEEISKGGIPPFKSTPGRGGGTFVTKKLVYAYAMWISPKFYDHVISTYDALVTDTIAPAPRSRRSRRLDRRQPDQQEKPHPRPDEPYSWSAVQPGEERPT
jgi:hypothetical protein